MRTPFRLSKDSAEFFTLGREAQNALKDRGGFVGGEVTNGKRSNETIKTRSILTLDFDKVDSGFVERVRNLPFTYLLHSTARHRPPEDNRFRVLVPLFKAITPDRYSPLAREVAQALGSADEKSFLVCQMMFWPVVPSDGDYFFETNTAPFLNPDEIRISQGDKGPEPPPLDRQAKIERILIEGLKHGEINDGLVSMVGRFENCGLTQGEALPIIREVIERSGLQFDENRTRGEIARLYNDFQLRRAKNEFKPLTEIICLADVEAEEVEWFWYPYIPLGKITLVQGDPGDGKTTVILNIAADLSAGRALPGVEPVEPGNVIYQTAEDGLADTIKPRLVAANADCKRIFVIDESEKGLSLLDSRIEEAMAKIRPRLFIIDPLQAYLGGDVDMHRANEVRPVLKKIGFLAEKYECSVIMIMHLSKASQSRSLYRGLGSVDIPAAARSVLLVGKNPNNPNERAIAHIKSSLAQNGKSLGFTITDFGIQWLGESPLTADDMLGAHRFEKSEDKNKVDEAVELVEIILNENNEATASDIFKAGKEMGISRRTIERARERMRDEGRLTFDKTSKPGKCFWRLRKMPDFLE